MAFGHTGFGNNTDEPTVDPYEMLMSKAGESDWAEEVLGGKRARQYLGFTEESWDPKKGVFAGTGRQASGKAKKHFFSYNTPEGEAWRSASAEQQAAIADAIETTLTNLYASRDAEQKSDLLLGKIQAKSNVMEQLVETRRVKREEELAHTRGLY